MWSRRIHEFSQQLTRDLRMPEVYYDEDESYENDYGGGSGGGRGLGGHGLSFGAGGSYQRLYYYHSRSRYPRRCWRPVRGWDRSISPSPKRCDNGQGEQSTTCERISRRYRTSVTGKPRSSVGRRLRSKRQGRGDLSESPKGDEKPDERTTTSTLASERKRRKPMETKSSRKRTKETVGG